VVSEIRPWGVDFDVEVERTVRQVMVQRCNGAVMGRPHAMGIEKHKVVVVVLILLGVLRGVQGQGSIVTDIVAQPGQVQIPFVGYRRTEQGLRFFVVLENNVKDQSFFLKNYLLTDRRLEFGGAVGSVGYVLQHSPQNLCKLRLQPRSGIPVDLRRAVRERNVPDYALVIYEQTNDAGCGFSNEQITVSKFADEGGTVYLYSPPFGPSPELDRSLIAGYTWHRVPIPQREGETTFSEDSPSFQRGD